MTVMKDTEIKRHNILGMELSTITPEKAIETISRWALQRNRQYVCVSNVHQCMETFDDPSFRAQVNAAGLILSDSQILAWFQRLLGHSDNAQVIRGVELMDKLCETAHEHGFGISLYGGTDDSLSLLVSNLKMKYPNLRICCAISPPFRPLTIEESADYIDQINSSGTNLLFVGIGCPKQEKWMANNISRLNCTAIGVGAAFDFLAGVTKQSPAWVHPLGLEWLWRLNQEPKRLWRRYAKHNPRFLWHVFWQLLGKQYR